MAATVEGTFKLIDQASGTLEKIRRKALEADTALKTLGGTLDRLGTKLDATTVKAQALASELNNVAGRYEVRIDTTGIGTAIAEVKALDRSISDLDRKVRVRSNTKGGLIGRLFGALPTFGNSNAQSFFGRLSTDATNLTQRLRPLAQGFGAVAGGIAGVATALPPMVIGVAALLPLIIALAGGITALVAALGGAAIGAGLGAAGLIGALAVGIGSFALVAKDALQPLKQYTQAMTSLQKAMQTGNPQAIQRAQEQVNALAKAHPGIAKLYESMHSLRQEFEKITAASRKDVFNTLATGIETAGKLLHEFSPQIRGNVKAFASALTDLFKAMQGPEFRHIIDSLSLVFQHTIGPLSRGLTDIALGMGELLRHARPFFEEMSRGFEGFGKRFLAWAKGSGGKSFVSEVMRDLSQTIKLLGAFGRLIGALFTNAAPSGRGMLQSLTETLNRWADWLDKNPGKVHQFFQDAARDTGKVATAMSNLVGYLWEAGRAMKPLMGAFLWLAKNPGVIAALVGGFVGYKGIRGAVKGATQGGKFIDALAGRGATPANPVFVHNVGGGLGGGGGGTAPRSTARRVVDAAKKFLPAAGARALTTPGIAEALGGGAFLITAGAMSGAIGGGVPGQLRASQTGLPPHYTRNRAGQITSYSIPAAGNAPALRGAVNPGLANYPDGGVMARSMLGSLPAALQRYLTRPVSDATKAAAADFVNFQKIVSGSMKGTHDTLTTEMSALVADLQKQSSSMHGQVARDFDDMYAEMLTDLRKIYPNGAPASMHLGAAGLPPNKKARGGRIGGHGLADTVPIGGNTIAAPGELVVNRHSEARANRVLGRFGMSLGGIVGGETKPHSAFAYGGRLATTGLKPGITRAMTAVLGKFPGLSITSTTGGGHAANSYHYLGEAVDLAGAPNLMNQAAAWIGRSMGHNLTEGIHNPNLSIKGGRQVPPSFWGAQTWAGHANHIHMAVAGLLGALSGLGGAGGSPTLRSRSVGGAGLFHAVGQGILNRARGRGNQRLADAVAQLGGGDFGGGLTSAGGSYNKGQLAGLWRRAGGNPSIAGLMAAIALAESGGNPRAHNPSGASGLWQILGVPFPGDPFSPGVNARMAVSKYNSQGLGAWETYTNGAYRQYMSMGGRMQSPSFGGWFGSGGSMRVNRPTYIGVGERGAENVTVSPVGQGNHIHIKQVVVYGGDHVRNEVENAFRRLEQEMVLHHGVDE